MEIIGFKNFKKIKQLEHLTLSPITFLVGENNSGKSTVIKGILAFKYLYMNGPIFSPISRMNEEDSDKNLNHWKKQVKNLIVPLDKMGLGTFKRVKNNKSSSDEITFHSVLNDHIFVYIVLKQNKQNANFANLAAVFCLEAQEGTVFCCDFKNDVATFKIKNIDSNKLFKEGYVKAYYYDNTDIPFCCNIKEDKNELELLFKLSELLKFGDEAMGGNGSAITGIGTMAFVLGWALDDLHDKINDYLYDEIDDNEYLKEIIDFCSNFLGEMHDISDIKNIEYIQAHQITHNNIINNRDYSNYVCSTINEFNNTKIQPCIKKYIKHWMSEFEIGEDYEIRNLEGEANIVLIIDKNGRKHNLADKGSGTIKIMTMLFRMAIILSDNSDYYYNPEDLYVNNTQIIIEEPEQNLHPRLQSKLADFFYESYKKYDFKFVIETHSEYIIRKTQVLVKKNDYNPFSVYYFRNKYEKEPYYEMEYGKDGSFINEFETGFYDESTKLLYDIL